MFTGIITSQAKLKEVSASGTNRTYWFTAGADLNFQIDDSIAHNGVCLTVEEIDGQHYRVTAIAETLEKTTLSIWKKDLIVNLEQAMVMGSRLDGHMVQGHVDGMGMCSEKVDKDGSTLYTFSYEEKFMPLIIEKGSICIDGISLTAFNVIENRFSVAVIPYTLAHTNLQQLKESMLVNLEFDLLGKYLARSRELKYSSGLKLF